MKQLLYIPFISLLLIGCGKSPTKPEDVNYTIYEGHTKGQIWVDRHGWWGRDHDYYKCGYCHGEEYGGDELSRVQEPREFTLSFEPYRKVYRIGDMVGCYDCHNEGPNGPYLDF